MKNFFQQVVRRNIFFLLGAGWLLTIAFIVDNYWYSSSSARYLRKHIESDVQQQEKSFDKFLTDTDSDVAPVDTRNAPPKIIEPGPVSLYVPDTSAKPAQKTEKDKLAATN